MFYLNEYVGVCRIAQEIAVACYRVVMATVAGTGVQLYE